MTNQSVKPLSRNDKLLVKAAELDAEADSLNAKAKKQQDQAQRLRIEANKIRGNLQGDT
jgi:predicted  nucleic acid-binding Zn-ribbon protein